MILERVAAVYRYTSLGFHVAARNNTTSVVFLDTNGSNLYVSHIRKSCPDIFLNHSSRWGQTDFVESNVQNPAVMLYLFSPEQPILPVRNTFTSGDAKQPFPMGSPTLEEAGISGSVLDRFILWRLVNGGFDRWDDQFPNLK